MYKTKKPAKDPNDKAKAYEYAVFLLSLRLRTIGEVLDKMKARGYTELVKSEVISQLVNQKYLNDQRYGEVYLENMKTYKNFGFYGIQKKLFEKKLPRDLVGQLLEEGFSEKEEKKIAMRFLKKEGILVLEKKSDEEQVKYFEYNDKLAKENQRVFLKLKARGFRSSVISSLALN